MKCVKCGKEITSIVTSRFAYDGSNYEDTVGIEEHEDYNAVIMETSRDWTGCELSEEEIRDIIRCPYCNQFPFGSDEVQIYDVVRIVCFKSKQPTEQETNGDKFYER